MKLSALRLKAVLHGVRSLLDVVANPTKSFDFLSGSLDPLITFTRASTGTYFNSSGVLSSAAINAPRFDYNPVTLAPKGLLIEEARTNLITYSEQLDDVSWSKTNTTISANSSVAPDGATTGDTVTRIAGVTSYMHKGVAGAAGQYTMSLYVKTASVGSGIGCRIQGTYPNRADVIFNISNGTIASAAVASGTATGASATITPAGNGWYRCTITTTLADSLTRAMFSPCATTIAATGFENAWGVALNCYAWGAQLETGAFATSYIPTTTTSLTRAADNANITGTNFSGFFNASAGTMLVEAQQDTIFAATKATASISNGTTSQRFTIFRQSAGAVSAYIAPPGAPVNGQSAVAGTPWKAAIAYGPSPVSFSVNGATPLSLAYTLDPSVLTQLTFGNAYSTGAEFFNGHIRSFEYYSTRLPTRELQYVTL